MSCLPILVTVTGLVEVWASVVKPATARSLLVRVTVSAPEPALTFCVVQQVGHAVLN